MGGSVWITVPGATESEHLGLLVHASPRVVPRLLGMCTWNILGSTRRNSSRSLHFCICSLVARGSSQVNATAGAQLAIAPTMTRADRVLGDIIDCSFMLSWVDLARYRHWKVLDSPCQQF